MTLVNLGSGYDYIDKWINVDKEKKFNPDKVIDLEKAKLPFEDNSVDIVRACHILEHIKNYIGLMAEINRILKPNGVLYIKVPEFPCGASVADPTHVNFFVPESFYMFTPNRPAGSYSDEIGEWFDVAYIESSPHARGLIDRGQQGRWFTEIECELIKRSGDEKSDNIKR